MRYPAFPFKRCVPQAGSLAAVLILLLSGQEGFAGNTNIKMRFSETGVWNTNPVMLSRNEKSIYGSETTAALTLIDEMPCTRINASVSATRNQFNRSDFNSTDFHGNTGLVWHSARWETALTGKIDYDTTRTSEPTTLGQNIGSVRHMSYSLLPRISYNTSQRSKIEIAGSWLESKYEDSFLSDYRTLSVIPSFVYSITPRQQAILSIQAQRYQSLENTDLHIDSIGPSIGWNASLTQNLSAELSAGALGSKFYGYATSKRGVDWNPVFSGVLSYKKEQNAAKVSATRYRQPYSNGSEASLTKFSAEGTYSFNPKLSLTLDTNYQLADQPPLSTNNLDTTWGGGGALSYKITKQLDITASYRYRKETLSGSREDAEQNIVRIGLSYRPDFGR